MKKYLYFLLFITATLFSSTSQELFWNHYTSALRGDKEAQFLVGAMFENGRGVDQNLSQAAKWFEQSALQGHVDAQYNLALMYATARGVEENQTKAIMWFKRAADQGDTEAKTILKRYAHELSESTEKSDKTLNGEEITIVATLLYPIKDAEVCDERFRCAKNNTTKIYTSIVKRGEYYKINGVIDKKGWKKYSKVGWIHEKEIERSR
jgi:TPR repeat protein